MNEKDYEQIIKNVEVYLANAVNLLKKAKKIQESAQELTDSRMRGSEMKRAAEFQSFSLQEMQKALELQKVYSERLNKEM